MCQPVCAVKSLAVALQVRDAVLSSIFLGEIERKLPERWGNTIATDRGRTRDITATTIRHWATHTSYQ